jgi:tRNA G26 N,N-dimethylase Trm1
MQNATADEVVQTGTEQVSDAAEQAFRPTPTARAILAYIAEHENEAVTKSKIADELGRCEKTIDRLVAKLRDNGYLAVECHWNERGAQLANTYTLLAK